MANFNLADYLKETPKPAAPAEKTEDGAFTFIYGTCCSKSPVAPDIFYANVGSGTCRLKVKVE